MNLTEDTIRKAIETFLGHCHSSLQVAWNLTIPQAINVCAYENLARPKTGKAQREALKVIQQAAINLDTTGTYGGS